jgi:predicted dinucleotide-binding enzyme
VKRIAVIGSGIVGETLANGLLGRGHEVTWASRSPAKLSEWKANAGANADVTDFATAAEWGEIVVLAVKGSAALDVVRMCGTAALAGKTIIDTTNPIADEPADNGVLRYFSDLNHSLMEELQSAVPEAHFVKAFSSVGHLLMVDPEFDGAKPTMFICGDNEGAKQEVSAILEAFGWDSADMGGVEGARAIEPLAMLWCIPGLLENRWTHAFRLLEQ